MGLWLTLGDPYRQLSDKSLKAWRLERWLIHGVLLFALIMTGFTLYSYFSGAKVVLGIKTQTIQDIYSFLIGSIFAGVIGTGFYPIFGNRVWCRFGWKTLYALAVLVAEFVVLFAQEVF